MDLSVQVDLSKRVTL